VQRPVCPICHSTTSIQTGFRAIWRADRLDVVRYLALLVLAVVFLTGLVWWVVFIGNTVVRLIKRR
jgi:hypothetical protein